MHLFRLVLSRNMMASWMSKKTKTRMSLPQSLPRSGHSFQAFCLSCVHVHRSPPLLGRCRARMPLAAEAYVVSCNSIHC